MIGPYVSRVYTYLHCARGRDFFFLFYSGLIAVTGGYHLWRAKKKLMYNTFHRLKLQYLHDQTTKLFFLK